MLRLERQGLTFKDPDTRQEWSLTAHECLENIFAALEDTFKKIISKMGITTVEGYRGALLFEAVGFGPELMEFLGDLPSRIGGIGLKDLVEDSQWRLQQADKMKGKWQARKRSAASVRTLPAAAPVRAPRSRRRA